MRLSGIILAHTEVFDERFWYSDGMHLICAQSVYDTKSVAELIGQLRESDQVGIFRNLSGGQAYSDSTLRHKRTDPSGCQRMPFEIYSTGLVGFPDRKGDVCPARRFVTAEP